MEITQHARYTCTFCGKVCHPYKFAICDVLEIELVFQDSVKRQAVGIWGCKSCKKVVAGGAWTVSTTAAATVRRYVFQVIALRDCLIYLCHFLTPVLFVDCVRSTRHRVMLLSRCFSPCMLYTSPTHFCRTHVTHPMTMTRNMRLDKLA